METQIRVSPELMLDMVNERLAEARSAVARERQLGVATRRRTNGGTVQRARGAVGRAIIQLGGAIAGLPAHA